MRVLFTSWAWGSHYFPMVPLGWALRAAGHEVRVAGPPGFAPVITQSALTAVAVGRDLDFAALLREKLGDLPVVSKKSPAWRNGAAEPSGRAAEMALRGLAPFVAMAENMIDDLLDFGTAWRPDLVVHEPTTYAGPLLAAALGVPSVRHLWGPDYTYAVRELESRAIAPLGERLGLGPVDTMGTVTVDPCPPGVQVTTDYHRQGVRYVPYNGPGVMPRWLLDPPARRRVCVTWGTSIPSFGENMFLAPKVIEAIADLDAETIVAVSAAHRELLGAVPQHVRVVESLPLHLLLPTCDLVIAQGGAGTTMTALASGVPLLVVAHLPDQVFNARQLADAGAGVVLLRDDATVPVIAEQARRMLADPSYRQVAAGLRREILDQPTPARVAAGLAELVEDGTPVR
ncbi:nucleotide disphospho-sugar-binding domain-containing protein [Actinokineospora enzanensis]|uniref:nucleotide disphospho-sugar-binding domain-containing protein n=1 Tax=Actinokineospora enzanensis TaxID=155975 RepID=UPI00035DA139|nr:nucleotide disphospho-sugar-binding domain-containing protein [Actinokineospora enzanensis]